MRPVQYSNKEATCEHCYPGQSDGKRGKRVTLFLLGNRKPSIIRKGTIVWKTGGQTGFISGGVKPVAVGPKKLPHTVSGINRYCVAHSVIADKGKVAVSCQQIFAQVREYF